MKIKEIVLSYKTENRNYDNKFHLLRTINNKYYLVKYYADLHDYVSLELRRDRWKDLCLYIKSSSYSRFKNKYTVAKELTKEEVFELQLKYT